VGSALSRLTPRQREILGLVAQGLSNSAIARQLVMADKSVEKALTATYEHLQLKRQDSDHHMRVQAVLAYMRDGEWIEPKHAENARRSEPSMLPGAAVAASTGGGRG